MERTYRLPAGAYAAVDVDQDIRTGRPEALEGLVAIVTLRLWRRASVAARKAVRNERTSTPRISRSRARPARAT